MKRLAALLTLLHMLVLPAALSAQVYGGARVVSTTSWIEEWDPVSESWVRVDESGEATSPPVQPITTITTHIVNGEAVSQTVSAGHEAARFASPVHSPRHSDAIAQYGPFRVIDAKRAALVASTGRHSPAHFDAMMRDFPELEVLDFVEAPGTRHDIANLALGRRIRAAGLHTHVPDGGSVRSGAVELFLAGATRTMEPAAQFAVHSWLDNYGREASDFAADAPENRLYLDYYVEMGMSEGRARNFYAMTNSVPHAGALWLRAADMEPWIAPEIMPSAQVRLASGLVNELPLQLLEGMPGALSIPNLPLELIAAANIGDTVPRIPYDHHTTSTLALAAVSPGEAL